MIFKRFFLCFLFSFAFVISISAQDEGKAILLKNIFENISKKHNITLNYIEEEIAIFKIVPPKEELSLNEKLNYISLKTKLRFKVISDNYISVFNNKKLDKPLCGYVLDSETKAPVIYATIKLIGTGYTTTSDEKGFFQIKENAPNEIEISHVSYEKMKINAMSLYAENCLEIFLKATVNELQTVEAPVILTKGISKKFDGTFELKPKKFGLLPGLIEPDVFMTMNQLPGIANTDETVSNISVRGGTHDQNLFLWNGIRLYQTSHFFGLISALNPNLANTIKISKNGSSPFYDESVSSVIDISTHSNLIENSSSSVGLNLINADFYTKFKLSKKSNLEISFRKSITDFLETPTYKNYSDKVFQNTTVSNLSTSENIDFSSKKDFSFYDATVQYHQKLNDTNEFYIDLITISNNLDVTQSKLENNISISKKSLLEQQTFGGSLLFKRNWNTKNKTDLSGYASYYKINSENQSIVSSQIFNQENDVLDLGLRLQNTHFLNDNFTFSNGYQLNEIGIRNIDKVSSPLFSRNIKDVLLSHSLIASLFFQSNNKKLKTTLGLRANYFEKFKKNSIEPRLQLNYAFSNSFQIEILSEQKTQNTSQVIDLQQDFLGIEKRRWVIANDSTIPIIKSSQLSIGFTFKKKNWLINVDNFYKKINGITSKSQGFQNQLEFVRINGDYTIFGTELLIQKQFKKFTTSVNYSFSQNDYQFDSFTPTIFPNNFEINHSLLWNAIYDFKNLKIALGTKWFTGKPTTLPTNSSSFLTTQEIEYQQPNSTNIENYFQLNFSSSYSIKMKEKTKFQIGFSIQNILNKDNITNSYYRINKNTSTIEQVNNKSLKLTPNVNLRYFF